MIGKISKGNHLQGLIEYLLREKDQKGDVREMAKVIGGTCDSKDARGIVNEMMYVRALRPQLGVYTFNESLRLPEGETLDDQQFAELGDSWAQLMGFDTYTIIKHSDSEIHVAGIRITQDGKVVSDSQDYKRSEAIIRQLEIEYGLSIVSESHLLNEDKVSAAPKQPTLGQRKQFEKDGKVPAKLFIADAIAKVLKDSNGNITASDFIDAIRQYGIEPIAHVASTGTMNGFSFRYDGKSIKASDVDRAKYSWSKLKRSVDYEYSRDFTKCAGTKISGDIRHDVELEFAARANSERTPEDIARISADIKAEEKLADAKRAAKSAERRASENNKSVIVSSQNRVNRGWWTGSDVAGDIVRQAIKTQIDAMPSEKYSVRLLRRDSDEAPITRTFTRDQLLNPKSIAWLRYQNITQEILMRPLDKHFFMLDDVSQKAVDYLRKKGFPPALVVETSPGNNQAWYNLRHRDFDDIDLLELLKFIIAAIMRLFGVHLEVGGFKADTAAMTDQRYGKLAGFTNRKPSREYEQGGKVLAPFVKVVEAGGQKIEDDVAADLVDFGKEAWHNRKDKEPQQRARAQVWAAGNKPLDVFFARKQEKFACADQSRADFKSVMAALYAGYEPDDIVLELQKWRGDEKDKTYAQRTVDKALRIIGGGGGGTDDKPQEPEPEQGADDKPGQ